MADYEYGASPWYDEREAITGIVIEAGVTAIGNYAFSGCSGLTTISIPGNVTAIGDYAFSDCDSLTEITLPDALEKIGEGAFLQLQASGRNGNSGWRDKDRGINVRRM